MSTSPSSPEGPTSGADLPPGLDPLSESDPRQIGPFRLVGRIGAGGMGVVYAVLDPSGNCIALKTVHAKYADRPGHREAFAREVQMLRRADGISTARLHGADPSAPVPWLAFDYVPGRDLNRHVREFGPLSGDMLRTFALGVAEGLATLHSAGIAHRDIKPGNVILSPDGPKIVDFGIAVEIGTDPEQDASASYGTPGWSAPERYTGAAADPAADVFAWGGLVTLAATGRAPFGSGDPVELAARVQAGDHHIEGVPEDLLALVERALSVAAADRPSAVDLLTELLPPVTVETELHAGAAPDRTRTQRVLRGMLADYWRGVDAAGHDPARWAAALGTASAVGLGMVGAGTLGSGAAASGGAGAGAAGASAGTASGMATAGTAGTTGGVAGTAGGATSMAAGATGSGGALGALTGIKGAVAVLGTLTLIGGAAAAGAWYLRDDAPAEQTVVAAEPEEESAPDPEDWAAMVAQAIDLANEVESFEAYQGTTTPSGHNQQLLHRYTEEAGPVLYQRSFGGPVYDEFLAVGGNPLTGEGSERLGRRVSEPLPGVPVDPGQYRRDPEPMSRADHAAEFGPGQWSFLWYVSLLLEPDSETDATYSGVTEVSVEPDSEWRWEYFDTEPVYGPAHHYTGTYFLERLNVNGPGDQVTQEYVFDLWIGEDGRFQKFEHYREPGPDDVEGADLERVDGWEVAVVSFDEPVTIEVPEESEIQP